MSLSEIDSLQTSLNEALNALKGELAAQNLPELSLNTSEPHPMDRPGYLPSPVIYEARRTALATMGLLSAMIRPPHESIGTTAFSAFDAACLRLAADLNLATLIGDSQDGVSNVELAEKTGVDPDKLERVFRLMVSKGWFREPRRGHFANNRLSNTIKEDSPTRHLGTYLNNLWTKCAVKFPEMVNHPDPEFRKSSGPTHTAFQLYHNTNLPFFGPNSWCDAHPEEAAGFARAMGGAGPTSMMAVAADFPWVEICKGKDAVVDVGGGQGTLSCYLAQQFPEIKQFIVQDLDHTRDAAEAHIKSKNLEERVSFEVQNFLTPQRRRGKYVFVLQKVLHDWNIEEGAEILRNLRGSLNEESTLVIVEGVVGSGVAAKTGPSFKESISKVDSNVYTPVPPPPFVPENFGDAERIPITLCVSLTALCNGYERNLEQLEKTTSLAGLKIKKVYSTRSYNAVLEVGLA